ncbi:hypothetical protein [Niveibacterium sp. SC-1]|uniref:hypothetical protein n=1 Tax=Niveibacterium sp. SC-1 TaxID=3135646 RepID=UPI00311FB0EE
MQMHALYVELLQWAFAFLNYLRICAYLPTLRKLAREGARSGDHSLQSWGVWTLSHLSLLLMLLEKGGYEIDTLVLATGLNLLMCALTCVLIARLRWRESGKHGVQAVGSRPRPQGRASAKTRARWPGVERRWRPR